MAKGGTQYGNMF